MLMRQNLPNKLMVLGEEQLQPAKVLEGSLWHLVPTHITAYPHTRLATTSCDSYVALRKLDAVFQNCILFCESCSVGTNIKKQSLYSRAR